MYKKLLTIIASWALAATAQTVCAQQTAGTGPDGDTDTAQDMIPDSAVTAQPADLPVILYTNNPKKYEIADIVVEGIKNYEDYVLIGLSGLSVGQVISVPGDEITDAINQLRNLRQGLEKDDSKVSVSGNEQWNEACEVMDKYGIEHKTDDGKVMRTDLDTMIASLEASQEEVSSDIQQEMVYVQDYMGQYNSYTQGSSSAISSANETLKTLARGG